jgi:hypothetical protein
VGTRRRRTTGANHAGGRVLCAGRLREEESFYRTINEGHRKHFAAMEVPVGSVGIAASQRSDVLDALAPYHSALDLPIVRVLADADRMLLGAVADAAAP